MQSSRAEAQNPESLLSTSFSLRMAYATLCYHMLRRSRVNVGRHPSTGEGNLSALYALHRVPPHKSNPPCGVGSDG